MKRVVLLLFCVVSFATLAATKVTVMQEAPWQLNNVPCGTQAQCQQAASANAQASPGSNQVVTGPTWLAVASTAGGIAVPCPNRGAMQPGDIGSSGGPPIFADPCHAKQ